MTELNLFCFILNAVIVIFIGILFPIMPLLTRKTFLFGVRIPEIAQQHPDARKLKSKYVIACTILILAILLLSIFQYIFFQNYTLVAICYIPFLCVGVHMIVFANCWKKAAELKKIHGWQISNAVYAESFSSHTRGKLTAVPWIYYVLSVVIVIISIVILLIQYPSFPDPIPTHFDINMNPDNWAAKSAGTVLLMPLINLATAVFMAIIAITIEKVKLQISTQNPALSFAQHRLYRKLMGHSLGILTLGMAMGLTFLTFMMMWPQLIVSFGDMMLILLLPCLPVIVVSVISGQGGCKLTPKITDKDTLAVGYHTAAAPGNPAAECIVPPVDRQMKSEYRYESVQEDGIKTKRQNSREEDYYWKLGMFYYNLEDPTIFVEDRFGNNIGLNYARTSVKIIVIISVLALIGLYIWLTPMLLSLTT